VTAPHLLRTPQLAKRLLLIGALLLAVGCDRNEPAPTEPGPLDGMPAASSPEGLMNAFVWSNQNLSIDGYRTLFTADYRFGFAAFDTSGNPYHGNPWTRDDELAYFQNLVNGVPPDSLPARSLILVFSGLHVENDTRAGKYDPERRKRVTAHVNLAVETVGDTWFSVSGLSVFYVVRGDSANIPDDLERRPDPGVWYIERWEDQGAGIAGAATAHARPAPHRALPGRTYTWGWLKTLYR
jgi:hypothetical protein